ncbi:hypothetical protein JCM10207_003690 [Rhodosporidiobolus poonsookiae]
MVKPMHEQDPRVKLLTVLNVQSAKPTKSKKRTASAADSDAPASPHKSKTRDWYALARKAQSQPGAAGDADKTRQRLGGKLAKAAAIAEAQEVEDEREEAQQDGEERAQKGKKAKRRKVDAVEPSTAADDEDEAAGAGSDSDDDDADDAQSSSAHGDSFARHFAALANPLLPDELSKDELDERVKSDDGAYWAKGKKGVVEPMGETVLVRPKDAAEEPAVEEDGLETYNLKLLEKLRTLNSKDGKDSTHSLSWLRLLSTYRDVHYPKLELGEKHDEIRQAASLHAMNHVLKTRSRILKNNDYLARQALAPSSSTPRNTADQSFTRPKVLILCPFRASALKWMSHLLSFPPPSCSAIESYPRFVGEYSLPEGAVDKLAERPEDYPTDHVETFAGNIDDAFRVGVKVTRKTVKVYSEFYQADVILASPLGLRTAIEKDGDADFLSSIEILVVDQMDVLGMQNWEHVQFVMHRLNLMPESDHGCDFSRVKPWYLDGKSAHLRQSLLLSRFDTPEQRSLFSTSLLNRAGKLRAVPAHEGVLDRVPKGVRQVWQRFESRDVWGEEDARWEWFKTKTLPTLLRSAVSSTQTLVLVPSYFDFLRLKRHLSTAHDLPSDFSFAAISEYSDTPDVSRARGMFFQGKVSWLIVTERFHFFRRYRLRGAKTFVFYAPPSHASYYPEFLTFPFAPPSSSNPLSSAGAFDPAHPAVVNPDELTQQGAEGEIDAGELTAHVLFSKWDAMRLERIVGSKDARRMVKEEEGRDAERGKRYTFL